MARSFLILFVKVAELARFLKQKAHSMDLSVLQHIECVRVCVCVCVFGEGLCNSVSNIVWSVRVSLLIKSENFHKCYNTQIPTYFSRSCQKRLRQLFQKCFKCRIFKKAKNVGCDERFF